MRGNRGSLDRPPKLAKIIEVVHHRIPQRFGLDPVRDVQVLCPMNRGGVGARSLNVELQRVLSRRYGATTVLAWHNPTQLGAPNPAGRT